jgi:hypothetical protein
MRAETVFTRIAVLLEADRQLNRLNGITDPRGNTRTVASKRNA